MSAKTETAKEAAVKKFAAKKAASKPEPAEPVNDGMYFKIGRTDFTKAINLVSIALPSKEYNDAKSGIMLDAKYDGDIPMLYMTANALDVFIRHGVRLNDDIEEGFVVPNGSFMTKLVRNLKTMKSPLELYFQDDAFQIQCGEEYSSTVQHYDPIGFVNPPSQKDIKNNGVISIPANVIKTTLDKVAFACSKDMTFGNATAVLIEQNDNGMTIIGTDGKRFSYLHYKTKVKNPKSVIIGVKYLQSLKAVLDALEIKDGQTLDLYMSDDKLYMIIGNTTVGIQIYGGTHPIQDEGGYDQFVIPPDNCEVAVKLDREKFMSALNLAIAHNNSSKDIVRMRLKGNKIGMLENGDASQQTFECEFDMLLQSKKTLKKPIVFDFSPDLLIDAINSIGEKEFRLFVVNVEEHGNEYGAGNMVIVRPLTDGQYEYLHVFSLN